MVRPDEIAVHGAREHNLRGVDVAIPRDALVVFTGVSGSGKSSLAYDTILKEGQRRFLESLSSYARQFLGRMERPDVDAVYGVSPTLAVDQKTVNRNPRSTVGTVTEIYDGLRLLLARLGVAHCPRCDREVRAATIDVLAERLLRDGDGHKVVVLAPVVRAKKGEHRELLDQLRADGWTRVRVDGADVDPAAAPALARYEQHTIEIVVDRCRLLPSERGRLAEALEVAARRAGGAVTVEIDGRRVELSTTRACPEHPDEAIPELEPRLFSFNAPQGACPTCTGLGALEDFDWDRLLDRRNPVPRAFGGFSAEGKLPFASFTTADLVTVCRALGAPVDRPVGEWPHDVVQRLVLGDPSVRWTASVERPGRTERQERPWKGLKASVDLVWKYTQWTGLAKFRTHVACPECGGERLRATARAVRFRGMGITPLSRMRVADARAFFCGLQLDAQESVIGAGLVREIRARLDFLDDVGLGYLTLDRGAATLSGGEAQRIRLAAQVGSGLRGVTYVLDEPSIGLHARDNARLLGALRTLRDRGNSVLVVEHDAETILAADWVVDVGPGAGREGGRVCASGPPSAVMADPASPTGPWLRGERAIAVPVSRRTPDGWLRLRGAVKNNLRDLDLDLPCGVLVAVTGVSGSGKSSLVSGVLEPSVRAVLAGHSPVDCASLTFDGSLDALVVVDQAPIGRTPRSNPATYTGLMDILRDLFAATPESKARGYAKGRFSFNVAGGRCGACEGAGVRVVEMEFLPDVEVPCETCGGRRFDTATREIRWRGLSIDQVLDLTIREAVGVFGAVPKARRILTVLDEVGLGYVSIGQPSTTLSGGEAQRIKLATELHRPAGKRVLYLLDEPTTGLHFADVERLLAALNRLVDGGHTVVVVEHHLDVVRAADHVIDLGPEGGPGGGSIVAHGSPEAVARVDSPTGRALTAPTLVAETPSTHPMRTKLDHLQVRGARCHNLQAVDVDIPLGALTVLTGPSGSGKTSLAFDTIFAEGQRRYVESLSTYARRFLGRMERAPVERIDGLQPAIAVDQRSSAHNPRSTVGTVTEVHDVLRLLYARVGTPHCPHCDRILLAHDPAAAAQALRGHTGSGWLLADLRPAGATAEARRDALVGEGWSRLWRDGAEVELAGASAVSALSDGCALVVDRGVASRLDLARLTEAVDTAYRFAGAARWVGRDGVEQAFSPRISCPEHGLIHDVAPTPRHFSFNARAGACATCEGLGATDEGTCTTCGGRRLRPEILAVRVDGMGIDAVCCLPIDQLRERVGTWRFGGEASLVAERPLAELRRRLGFLDAVGLGYLSLDRTAGTLSGGEAQRIRLAASVGSALVGVTYVLDEPTVGLHARDTDRLLSALVALRDNGNTVIVVEHDLETIRKADHVVDFGPGAGHRGGLVLDAGVPADLVARRSPTGQWLSGALRLPARTARPPGAAWIRLRGASGHNLRGVDLDVPVGRWTAVTGVSGSGKSSLVLDTLVPALRTRLRQGTEAPLPFVSMTVDGPLDGVVVVDQAPMGRNARSCPATFVGVMDDLRDLFASTAGSRMRGYPPARFSFNAAGGRCEACEGRGATLIEMHFLPDVWVACDACGGKRFGRETLEIRWAGHNIADVLAMPSSEALVLFQPVRRIARALQAMVDVGLGYLTLGQPGHTLSGGEAQRLKLAADLGSRRGAFLYVLDEPTTGLHMSDVAHLVTVLDRLVDAGHTVITVEHHVPLVQRVDWIVDLGPEGGVGGGRVVATGAPADVARARGWTAAALAAEAG